jgi:predicted transcriptional regulator
VEVKSLPISAEEFEKGKSSTKKDLSEVLEEGKGYTTKEVADLIGRSWGIAKGILKAAVEEGTIETKKVGRSIFWRLKP